MPPGSYPSPEALSAFQDDLEAIHEDAKRRCDRRAYRHLRRIELGGWAASAVGYLTAAMAFNPVSAALIALANVVRWTVVAHHVTHRGYDRCPGVARRHTSRGFAAGWRRFLDWPEWMVPEAWCFEHNVLHHYHTGEELDPDVVERNFALMRRTPAPRWLKLAIVGMIACVWKPLYYAPNTLWTLRRKQDRPKGIRADEVMRLEPTQTYHGTKLLLPTTPGGLEFWGRCVLPYVGYRFVLLPALFLPLGGAAVVNVLWTSLLAEALANLHSFFIIVPNHSGDDVLRFERSVTSRAEFYYHQVVGSANYTGGSEWKDLLQGYLNYQIEHHLWPNLPASVYREIAPRVREVCERHGVPYRIESLDRRIERMLRLMTGESTMPRLPAESGVPNPKPS